MIKPHIYSKKYGENSSKLDATVTSAYGLPPPTNEDVNARLNQIDDMKLFFTTATHNWDPSKSVKKFALPGGENVACVLWNDLFFISGTDIVRSLNFRFHAFGRPVTNAKKFEEGIFSDLRNLKPGHDARLEEPKSELLDMLYKNNCIRTQKKQKVFYWFSVPHDRLFLDALERDLKREKMGMEPTTKAVAEPATSISLDSTQELFDQMRRTMSQSIIPSDTFSTTTSKDGKRRSPKLGSSTFLSSKVTKNKVSDEDHTSWSPSQSRLERAAVQAKRARVNSVPAKLGKQQQSQLLHQQRYHRLSHGSYFAGKTIGSSSVTRLRSGRVIPSSTTSSMLSNTTDTTSTDDSFRDDLSNCSGTTALTDISKPSTANISSPMIPCHNNEHQQPDYMDPISNGVNDLDITASMSNSTTLTHKNFDQQQQQQEQHEVTPSKSVDPNVLKKSKTIFGSLSLFDGSPSYKQRRRRATSVSMSAQNSQLQLTHTFAGSRPERIRRQHQPATGIVTLPQLSHSLSNMNSNSTSRLAMAAAKAGFVSGSQLMAITPTSSPTTLLPVIPTSHHSQGWSTTAAAQPYFHHHPYQQQQDIHCPVMECRHVFNKSENLERHMHAAHMFVCALCGKNFSQSGILAQHHRLEHEIQPYDYTPPTTSFLNDNDDDSSPDINQPYQRGLFDTNTSQPFLYQQQQQQGTGQRCDSRPTQGFYSTNRHSFDNITRSSITGLSAADIAPAAAVMAVAATTASSVKGSYYSSSRCSTLSPMLDVDYDMSDIDTSVSRQQQQQPTHNTTIMGNMPARRTSHPLMPLEPINSSTATTGVMVNNNNIMDNTLFSAIHGSVSTSQAFVTPPMAMSSRSSSISTSNLIYKKNFNNPNSSPMEDDLTSSSASSPSSTFQFGNNHSTFHSKDENGRFLSTHRKSITAPLTLLSPFKPIQYQQLNVQSDDDEEYRQQQKETISNSVTSSATILVPTSSSGANHSLMMDYQQRHYNLTQPIFDENSMLMSFNNPNHFNFNTTVSPTSLLNDSHSIHTTFIDQPQYTSTPFINMTDMNNIVFGA
ncbi:STE like transcription factor-domain-containing protein [Mycotypha africana]|uniref:STE like transcription factor-domain-containing protein n=1 Tax=Mycotypha africana TaxID=64632 RepID=UPI002300A465|nr:STE like transcription factor-domain-containing protein [Mycotypha africana]KAI8971523.1 STE like transcription factor-domain-containing protein [Mycotypha africana]